MFRLPVGLELERAGESRLLSNASAEINLLASGHQCDNNVALSSEIKSPLHNGLRTNIDIRFDLKSGRTTR
jgi:hypothetical protein